MRVDERPPDHAPQMRLRHVEGERAVAIAVEPHDVARARLVQAACYRRSRGRDVTHRRHQLRELVLVPTLAGEAVRAEGDARERVGEALAGELDREPPLIARADSRGHTDPLLGGRADRREQRGERSEHLVGPRERALDHRADPLRGFGAQRIAESARHRERVRDAGEIAAESRLRELEPKGAGRDVLEPVGLIDDDALGPGQKRAAHPRVLQQEGVVDHNDARGGRGVAGTLQVAPARRALAPALIARLVVRRDPRPQLPLAAHEVELRAVATLRRRPPDKRLAERARLLTRRDRATEDLPPPGTEIVRPPLQHRDRDVRPERRLHRGHVLPHELVLERERVGRDDHPLAGDRGSDRRNEVRDGLADAGPGLRDERTAFRERALDRRRELALLRAVLVTLESRDKRTLLREHLVHGQAPGRWSVCLGASRGSSRGAESCPTRVVDPCPFRRRGRRVAEELGRGGAYQLGERRDLGEDERRQGASDAREMTEHERGGDRVVERSMRGVGQDRRVGGEPLERVARSGRQQDRRELGGVEAVGARSQSGTLEERGVEADVVTDQARRSIAEGERAERRHRDLGSRRAHEVVVADPGEAHDRRRERAARIDEGHEPLAEDDAAFLVEPDADRSDLDDPLALGFVSGRFDVDGDEVPVQRSPI